MIYVCIVIVFHHVASIVCQPMITFAQARLCPVGEISARAVGAKLLSSTGHKQQGSIPAN